MFNKEDLIKLATMAMPFGKYKGRVLIDLPEAYLLWFAQQGFPNGQLGGLLQLTLELKINGLEYLIRPLQENQAMTIDDFLRQLKAKPETVEFQQTIDLITQHYDYTPAAFSNGVGSDQVNNAAGTNEGSCRIFAFAQINKLTTEQTLACFGKFYRDDVLKNPQGTDHANIRTFIRHGWEGIKFERVALARKN
jgi:uncharacterized protein (DUF3820 family)